MSRRRRPLRILPPAVTPIRLSDLVAGVRHRESGLEAFREDVSAFLGASHVATYASVSGAIRACLLELRAADGGDKTAVVVPAFSSPVFAETIEAAGLSVRYCDLDPESLAVDPASLDALDAGDALALFAVNLLGYGSRMDELADRCRRADCHLVEVLGYSLGTEYRGRRLGTFGDCALLNFQEGKPVPVGGGMVASNVPGLAFSDDGRPRPAGRPFRLVGYAALSHPRPYALYRAVSGALSHARLLDWRPTTHVESPGATAAGRLPTMTGFQGAVASRVFSRLDVHRARRAAAARFYADGLADCAHVRLLSPAPGIERVQHVRYPVLVDDEALRRELSARLLRAGIQSSTLYGHDVDASRYPGSARLARELLTLPTHPYATPADWRRTVELIVDVCSRWTAAGRYTAPIDADSE